MIIDNMSLYMIYISNTCMYVGMYVYIYIYIYEVNLSHHRAPVSPPNWSTPCRKCWRPRGEHLRDFCVFHVARKGMVSYGLIWFYMVYIYDLYMVCYIFMVYI